MLVYENHASTMKFFRFQNWMQMNLKIITTNHEADPEIWFLTKSISKPYAAQRPCRQRGS